MTTLEIILSAQQIILALLALTILSWSHPRARAALLSLSGGLLAFFALTAAHRRGERREEDVTRDDSNATDDTHDTPGAPEIGAPIDFEIDDETHTDSDRISVRPP